MTAPAAAPVTVPALQVRVVCRAAVSPGFELSGLVPRDAASLEDGGVQLSALLERPEVGVVLLEDAIYDHLPDALRRRLGRRPLPIVVPFPGPVWAAPAVGPEAYIVELLRQVIGYRVRLK